jgi:hypothetical protein
VHDGVRLGVRISCQLPFGNASERNFRLAAEFYLFQLIGCPPIPRFRRGHLPTKGACTRQQGIHLLKNSAGLSPGEAF